ncbi:MAG TPA: hypothetical protein PK620_00240 [Denitromonas sp.]|uniref:hypothetical protein n=1 Tax=Denitromonas sp. TaxID=2734609 RepID=UPI001D3C8B5B|nr:hypothetical protein [Rhodocyclaceae bacterium]MCP5220551.1 hypothetical protein [Zoogloeaceae bacterium]HQU87174.1 hypothetical protein [Denitromonas sp.]HQV13312.1 hypothetical protein [Denitromonas sp.]
MLLSALKIVGASLLAVALIWALVLGWWQGNDHTPSTTELFLYLGALPLAIVGGYGLLRGFIEHLKAPVVALARAPDDTLDPLANEDTQTAAMERGYTINLIGAFAISSGGEGPSEILAAQVAGARPLPDSSLLDDAGFPVFTARVDALDIDGITESLAQYDTELAQDIGRSEHLRMLALIDSTLPAGLAQAHEALTQRPATSRLSVVWLMPSEADPALFPKLQSWLQAQYLSAFEPSRVALTVRPALTESDVMAQIDRLVLDSDRRPNDDLTLVLAAVSTIGPRTVDAWSMRQSLFSAEHQNGQIPGECGVCLLFGSTDNTDTSAQLTRVSAAERDKSVDAAGRVSGALIEQLITGLLTVHDIAPADIRAVISDADHRQSRTSELLDALGESFSELDPIADCPRIGAACGSSAPFGALLALACAHAKSLSLEQPVICVSQQHPKARAVVLLRPTPLPAEGMSSAA